MELSGGEVAAKRAGAGEDRLSALPDDVLVLILLRLDTTAAAARTSVLSRRWRPVWALLPELSFPGSRNPHLIRDALGAHQAGLRRLSVGTVDATAKSVAAWLPVAAARLSGPLIYNNVVQGRNAEGQGKGETFELPCFEKATSISLDLGFLGFSMPLAGVFARLTELSLVRVRFNGTCELAVGDDAFSLRCPCLLKLIVQDAQGLLTVTIYSESLQLMKLYALWGLWQLTVVAPVLKDFALGSCFRGEDQVVNISAPQLKFLTWEDSYDTSSVQLGNMEHLQSLRTLIHAYGSEAIVGIISPAIGLLPRFKVLRSLSLTLAYVQQDISNYNYLMEHMTMLPDIMFLHLDVTANGHAFGASAFHVLRMCSGIRRLLLGLNLLTSTMCPSGCICGQQPPDWKTEGLLLNYLQEIEIVNFRGLEHEVSFVKRLFSWATVLKNVRVTFEHYVTECMAKELFQMLLSFSRPEICMKYYIRASEVVSTGNGSRGASNT